MDYTAILKQLKVLRPMGWLDPRGECRTKSELLKLGYWFRRTSRLVKPVIHLIKG